MFTLRSIVSELARQYGRTNSFTDRFVAKEHHADPDLLRKSRLIVNFGLLGSIFGSAYAILYLCIDHFWGAAIVLLCTLGLIAVGLSGTRNLLRAGNFQALIMICGFTALAFVEGGVSGHAVGWIATVPISALVLADLRSGLVWLTLALICTATFALFSAFNIDVPFLYPARWHPLVTAAGYISLTLFAGLLGFVIELGRRDAHQRMETAIRDLAAANQDLALLNEEKTAIFQVVAHDLKSPLQAVLGHAGLIAKGFVDTDEEIKSSADSIVSTARRMNALIGELLNKDAFEDGQVTITLEDLDLNAIAAKAVSYHQLGAERKGTTLALFKSEQSITVRTAGSQAMQVLDNLLSNAIKYSLPNSEITVLTRLEAAFGLIEVRDNGPGISEEDQQMLFHKFAKLTARPTAGESSNGLGLSIAKALTEAMGGSIDCQSQIGAGSTFFLRLPLAKETA